MPLKIYYSVIEAFKVLKAKQHYIKRYRGRSAARRRRFIL